MRAISSCTFFYTSCIDVESAIYVLLDFILSSVRDGILEEDEKTLIFVLAMLLSNY